MKYVLSLLSKKRVLAGSLTFVKWWYFTWLFFLIVTAAISIFHFLASGKVYIGNSRIPVLLIFIFECVLYIQIIKRTEDFFSLRENNNKTSIMYEVGVKFFLLFFLDFVGLFFGEIQSESKNLPVLLLKSFDPGSNFYAIYSKIYSYIPVVFNFIKPNLEGSSLLVMASVLIFSSKALPGKTADID